MAVVELDKVEKAFGGVLACAGVDLRIEDGEFVTLLGPSGCGKTTTLNLIAGLEDPTAGEIRMNGRRVNELTPFERDVAMVFQNYALYPHMTVAENIGFTLRLRRRPRAEIRRRVGEVAAMLEIAPLLDRLPAALSGGQQQRVALGRAVIREAQVFLYDEPFSNLDAELRVKMRSEIRELHQRIGTTSVFVTHDQEEALSISDRIAVMRGGRIEQLGTPEEVYLRPLSAYVARFIGSPQIDLLPGTVEATAAGHAFRVGEARFALPDAAAIATTGGTELGIRPEHVALAAEGIAARVRVVHPVGPATFATLDWSGGALTARLPGLVRLRPGETVHFRAAPEHLMLFDAATGRRLLP